MRSPPKSTRGSTSPLEFGQDLVKVRASEPKSSCSVTSIGDGVYNFTNIPAPEDEAARWVEEAQRRGIKSMALLAQDYPSIDGHVKALIEEAARRGIRIA